MRSRGNYSNHSVRVCLSICLLSQNLPSTSCLRQKQSFIGFFVVFSKCDFAKNALFKSFGHRCLPCSLASFQWIKAISTRKVCMVSNRLNERTCSSLIIANWQISFLSTSLCISSTDMALLYGTQSLLDITYYISIKSCVMCIV